MHPFRLEGPIADHDYPQRVYRIECRPPQSVDIILMPVKKFRPIYQDQVPVKAPPKAPVVTLDEIQVPEKRKYNKDELKVDVQWLSQRLVDYLKTGDRFERLLMGSKVKDITVMLGILTDKLLLLEGQPTQIISQQMHQKMDTVMPALLEEIKRRGMKAELTERKIDVTVAGQA